MVGREPFPVSASCSLSQSQKAGDVQSYPKKQRFKRILICVLIALGLLWIVGDLVYSRVVNIRQKRWETGITRDQSGIREGCQAYTLGSGQRAVLMIHGINDSPFIYHKMAPRFADAGYTVRVMRLPGFAKPIEEYAQATAEDWLAGVAGEVDRLKEDHEEVYLVAHSLGGAIAIRYVVTHQGSIGKLALIAPAIAVSSQRSPLLSTRQWHRVGNALLFFSTVTESPFPNDAHDPKEKEYPMRTPFSPRSVIDETFRLIDMNQRAAPQLHLPLIVIASRDDVVVDPDAIEAFYESCASKEKQILFTEDTGHAIPIDYGWEDVSTNMIEFFGRNEVTSE